MPAMNIYSIYKATNKLNGKVYIGFDSNWPQRMWEHKCPVNFNKKYKFYNALRKYGLDGFEWNVIYQSLDRKHCLHVMEPYFINEYNSLKKGYNSTLGGEGMFGYKHTENFYLKKRKPVIINDIAYSSRSEAREKLNVCWKTLYKMIDGKIILPHYGRSGKYNGQSKSITIFGIEYESKTQAKNKLGIGWKLLNKIINENLDCIPKESLSKSQNSFKGFANKKLADNQVYRKDA